MEYSLRQLLRESMLIAVALGIPAGVLSNAISNALFAQEPNWPYAAIVTLLIGTAVLLRVALRLNTILKVALAGSAPGTRIRKVPASERRSVGGLLLSAREEIVFFGISGKRTVTEDFFRRALERMEHREIRIRFLLLDPLCEAFDARAKEEGEPTGSWGADLETTAARLSAYKRHMALDVRLKYYASYPIWRAIVIDREKVFVSVFLPGKRGTEASQYILSKNDEELAQGIIKAYLVAWKSGRELDL